MAHDAEVEITLAQLEGVKEFSLSDRGLDCVPRGLASLGPALVRLDLSLNPRLASLGPLLSSLNCLVELNVEGTAVAAIPELPPMLRCVKCRDTPLAEALGPDGVRRAAALDLAPLRALAAGGASGAGSGRPAAPPPSGPLSAMIAPSAEDALVHGRPGADPQVTIASLNRQLAAQGEELAAARAAAAESAAGSAAAPCAPSTPSGGAVVSQLRRELASLQQYGRSAVPRIPLSQVGVLNSVDGSDLLGQGAFARVVRASWPVGGVALCALKEIFDPSCSDTAKEELHREVSRLELCRHPNIVRLIAVIDDDVRIGHISELAAAGSLMQRIHRPAEFAWGAPAGRVGTASTPLPPQLPESEAVGTCLSVARALAYLHGVKHIVHKDIKSPNLLLTVDPRDVSWCPQRLAPSPPNHLVLCDFGISRALAELNSGAGVYAGTPPYMAPEMWTRARIDAGVDVWALGVTLFECVAGAMPSAGLQPQDIQAKAAAGGDRIPLGSCSRELASVHEAMTAVEPGDRCSAARASELLERVARGRDMNTGV